MKHTPETVVLLNCGCEDIQKIARSVRDHHFYTMVMPYSVPVERLTAEKPAGLILLADEKNPAIAEKIKPFLALGIPVFAAGAAVSMAPGAPSTVSCADVDAICDFCRSACQCTGSWTMERFIDEAIRDVRELVGKEQVVLGLSGGVDSSVVAALLHKAIGDQLTCVFVNHGLLRKNEAEQVQQLFGRNFKMKLKYVDASDLFLDQLAGVDDPEKKRKIIGKVFIDVFAEAANETGATFLGQGTIYPDIIESIPLDGNPDGVIKSHHNVGGLPPNMKFKLVEPVERLFKDEVRAVGRLLGLPPEVLDRHPFPGPSLGVRHLGAIDRKTLHVLREADAIVTEELHNSGWYAKTWQTFAIFVPVKTVGMKDHKRTYDHVIAIRSVNSVDAVTAEAVRLPWELLFKMSDRIVREVDGVNRVVYDITHKPPGTIEWE